MQFDVITWYTILLLLVYFIGCDCKKKKPSFTFEALMAGMNGKEKEMFKEELNKEVKRFRQTQQKHHKQKVSGRTVKAVDARRVTKKRKVTRKLPKFLPGICDPICQHECVHGCDFRCCIPGYQQSHKIPRPPPTVVLPGSCSPTCSPTCRPLCTESCCTGGMFQSSKDLVTLNSQTCPSGCSKSCLPKCTVSCCVAHINEPEKTPAVQSSPAPQQRKEIESHPAYTAPAQPNPPHTEQSAFTAPGRISPAQMQNMLAQALQNRAVLAGQARMTPMILRGPPPPMLVPQNAGSYLLPAVTKCAGSCTTFCGPLCNPVCCVAGKRHYTPMMQNPFFQRPRQLPFMTGSMKSLLPVSKQNCPVECFSSCKPTCEVRCCNLQPNLLNQVNHVYAAYGMRQPAAYLKSPSAGMSGGKHISRMSGQPAKDGRVVSETTHVESMDPNFGSNIETIHALSKDMILKPGNANQKQKSLPKNPIAKNSIPKKASAKESVPKVAKGSANVKTSIPKSAEPDASLSGVVPGEKKSSILISQPEELLIKKSVLPAAAQPMKLNTHNARRISESPPLRTGARGSVDQPTKDLMSMQAMRPMKTSATKKSNVKDQLPALQQTASSTAESSIRSSMQATHLDVKQDEVLMTALKSAETPTPKRVESKKSTLTADLKSSPPSSVVKKSMVSPRMPVKLPETKKSDVAAVPRSKGNKDIDKKTKLTPSCPHQCPNECAPLCGRGCCNRQIVYEAFHNKQKKSKIMFQLERLK